MYPGWTKRYWTFKAYLLGVVISSVLATSDFAGSKTSMIPDQSGLRSVDLQTGQTLPLVRALHFLQAFSLTTYYFPPFFSFGADVAFASPLLPFLISSCIQSRAPRNG